MQTESLFDLCCDYLEHSHTGDGQMTANKTIYNLCADYANGGPSEMSKNSLEQLRNYFSKYLN